MISILPSSIPILQISCMNLFFICNPCNTEESRISKYILLQKYENADETRAVIICDLIPLLVL